MAAGAAGAYSCGVRPSSSFCALAAALASTLSGRAMTDAAPAPPPARVVAEPVEAPAPPPPEAPVAWAAALPALRFYNTRTAAACSVRLYTDGGVLDAGAASALDRVAAERDTEPRPLDRRVLQLVVKAATHFHAAEVDLVSTFRDGARPGSRHRRGQAIDFALPGVAALKLAAHLRGYARVGVGVYTNRRTQFVHLDVREQTFHWADASPPGRWWRETPMTDRAASLRDAAYAPEQDLPVEERMERRP